ncbi:MAG: hypothetical protein HOI95_09405 [Chromatiales bacterium]|jgi:hypothetical protein|nr:hypothetical protein [Chromatiales bacterium]
MKVRQLCTAGAVAFALLACDLVAARVKLVSLPVRERVEVRLDHAVATLVEEARIVPLVQGVNQVDFAWANTRIDASSIVFRVVGEEGVRVLSVSYPPGEAALVWSVFAPTAGAATVRISYLLDGLGKTYSYRALATTDERSLRLSQYVRLRNDANESFGETGIWLRDDQRITRPLDRAETRELLVERWPHVPVLKTFSVDPAGVGWLNQAQKKLKVAMHYVVKNDTDSGLGKVPLPAGKARIFQEDGRGGSAFLGEDWGQRTAPGDEMRLFLGLSRDVVVKRSVIRNERRRVEGNLFEQHIVLRYAIENFKDEPVALNVFENTRDLRRRFVGSRDADPEWRLGPDTSFAGKPDPKRTDVNHLVMQAPLPAAVDGKARKVDLDLHIILNNEW